MGQNQNPIEVITQISHQFLIVVFDKFIPFKIRVPIFGHIACQGVAQRIFFIRKIFKLFQILVLLDAPAARFGKFIALEI